VKSRGCLEATRDLARSALADVVDPNALEMGPIIVLLIAAYKLPVHFLPTESRKWTVTCTPEKHGCLSSLKLRLIISFQKRQHQQQQAVKSGSIYTILKVHHIYPRAPAFHEMGTSRIPSYSMQDRAHS
jgi:hypothetical protein